MFVKILWSLLALCVLVVVVILGSGLIPVPTTEVKKTYTHADLSKK